MNYKQYIIITFLVLVYPLLTFGMEAGIKTNNDVYLNYALKVKDFDTTGYSISKAGDGEINIKNSGGSILRFRVNEKDELLAYHCGIVYIYYEFSSGWINRYKTYDKNAEPKGDDEFDDLATVEYEIKKMNLLHAKFEVLDQADGNIEMNDVKDKIVYIKAYNSKNKLIKENYISSKEYWNANNVIYRP